MARRTWWEIAAIAAAIGLAAASSATETTNYSYDARGRLAKVVRTGTISNNVTTNYTYDKADNRTNVTVTNSTNSPP